MDIEFYCNELYVKNQKGYSVIGIWDSDVCSVIPYQYTQVYHYVIDCLKEEKEIENRNLITETARKNLERLAEKYEKEEVGFSEIKTVSLLHIEKEISGLSKWLDIVNKHISVNKVFSYGNILLGLMVVLLFCSKKKINYINLYSFHTYFVSVVAVYFFIILHELGHLLYIRKCGLIPKSLNFSLKYGLIPVFYVKTYNLYSLRRKDYLFTMGVGLLVNVFFMQANFFLLYLTENFIFAGFCIANYRIILNNISPLGLTDGYFIMSVWTCSPNLRKNIFRFLQGKGISAKNRRINIIYIVGSAASVAVSGILEGMWLARIVERFITVNAYILQISIVLLFFSINIVFVFIKLKRIRLD